MHKLFYDLDRMLEDLNEHINCDCDCDDERACLDRLVKVKNKLEDSLEDWRNEGGDTEVRVTNDPYVRPGKCGSTEEQKEVPEKTGLRATPRKMIPDKACRGCLKPLTRISVDSFGLEAAHVLGVCEDEGCKRHGDVAYVGNQFQA